MFPKEVIKDAQKIGQYYLQENSNDYCKTEDSLRKLCITNIYSTLTRTTIILKRPGLIIGRLGENLRNLSKFLGKEVHIIEDYSQDIYYHLVPINKDFYLNF